MRIPATILSVNARGYLANALWRYLGRPIVLTALAILVAVGIVHGELWAIEQAPLLLANADTGCAPGDNADSGTLPVAILH